VRVPASSSYKEETDRERRKGVSICARVEFRRFALVWNSGGKMLVVVVVVGKKKNKSEKGVVEVGEGRTSGSSPFLLVGEQQPVRLAGG
jgi:hypothetical protein